MIDNMKILFEAIRDNPKKSLIIFLVALLTVFFTYKRVPQLTSCIWQAGYVQKLPWDNFDFRELSGDCVVKRGDRWIPLDKVVDAGDLDVQ